MEIRKSKTLPPLVFNVFKPARAGSFDVVRHFKKNLPQDYGRIGHFGTLDPFACGVLLIGIGGAARLNDLVHAHLPKTYLAIGKLGIETATGDWEGEVKQRDTSQYLNQVISSFDIPFIQNIIEKKFMGDYWQTPPIYSATKFQGKPLHAWAREGVEIKKEPVKRHIYSLEIVKWKFPYLSLRATVSSGTYIRTLFQEIANELGTIGSLIALQRESVGSVTSVTGLKKIEWPLNREFDVAANGIKPEDLLLFERWSIPTDRMKPFENGLSMRIDSKAQYLWGMGSDGENWGLLERKEDEWKIIINFRAMKIASSDQL